MGYYIITSKDVLTLIQQFLKEADYNLSIIDSYTFNNLMTVTITVLYHVEVIFKFKCLDNYLDMVYTIVYLNMVANFFVGGLCL